MKKKREDLSSAWNLQRRKCHVYLNVSDNVFNYIWLGQTMWASAEDR